METAFRPAHRVWLSVAIREFCVGSLERATQVWTLLGAVGIAAFMAVAGVVATGGAAMGQTASLGDAASLLPLQVTAPVSALSPAVILTAFLLTVLVVGGFNVIRLTESIAEKKRHGTPELLMVAVSPGALLHGLVVGRTLFATVQAGLLLLTAVGVGGLFVQSTMLAQMTTAAAVCLLLFMATYAVIAPACSAVGALVSSVRRRSWLRCLSFSILGMLVAVGGAATGTLLVVLSFVPVASVSAMPMRILSGDGDLPQVVSVLLLSAVLVVLAAVFGGARARAWLLP